MKCDIIKFQKQVIYKDRLMKIYADNSSLNVYWLNIKNSMEKQFGTCIVYTCDNLLWSSSLQYMILLGDSLSYFEDKFSINVVHIDYFIYKQR